jgi:hypothetical protein
MERTHTMGGPHAILCSLVCLFVLGLGMTHGGAGETPGKGGTLRVAIDGEPPSLGPHWTTATVTHLIASHALEGLYTFGKDDGPVPMLAEAHTLSDDGLVYTFKLRRGIPFHHGKELTAQDSDVLYKLAMATKPQLEAVGFAVELQVMDWASRVAVLFNPIDPIKVLELRALQVAAQALGVQLQVLEVRGPGEFETIFAAMSRAQPEALITLGDQVTITYRIRIVDLATKHRLPAIYDLREFVDAGGLVAYGPSLPALFRRSAAHVDRILKGAKPADLPVEQPMTFELVINLKTARALDLTIPPSLLIQADMVMP